jgi:hypothetical protein
MSIAPSRSYEGFAGADGPRAFSKAAEHAPHRLLNSLTPPITLLACAIYTLLLSSDYRFAKLAPYVTVALLILAAGAALRARVRPFLGFNGFELAGLAACVMSLVATAAHPDDFVLSYTLAFALTVAASGLVVRFIGLKCVLDAASAAYVAMVATVTILYFPSLINSLNQHARNRWQLRFSPFEIHPNLMGFIFGIGAILLAYRMVTARRRLRVLFGATSIMSLVLIIAASARGSLLALIPVGAVVLIRFGKQAPRWTKTLMMVTGLVAAAGALVGRNYIISYLATVLELDSRTRGLDSGGTGRFELWKVGLNFLKDSGADVLIGRGLRSASVDKIGFSTESSYITILIESGVVIGALLIGSIIAATVRSYRLAAPRYNNTGMFEWAVVFAILLFALIESFFNRYLIGIGNPGSYVLLLLYIGASEMRSSR